MGFISIPVFTIFYGAKDPGAGILKYGEDLRKSEYGNIFVFGIKFLIIWPFFYHTFQGRDKNIFHAGRWSL